MPSQKRFRARQRERARDSAAQMEALSAQMGRLMQEKAELETRNRILEQVVKLNVDHVEQLQSHKVWKHSMVCRLISHGQHNCLANVSKPLLL